MNITKILSALLIISLVWSCKTQKTTENMNSKNEDVTIDFSAGPTTFLYKTKGDYNKLVPVVLSDDKAKIISYPHPRDVYYKGELAYPTVLEDGYLLDNRGISLNVAFLKVTYEDYSKLEKSPTVDELLELVIDNDPLTVLYNCGNRNQYKDDVTELNNIISSKHLDKCKKIAVK